MDEHIYRRLVAEQEYFVAQEQHRLVEIRGQEIHSQNVGEQALKAWIGRKNLSSAAANDSNSTQSTFRLLIGSPRVLEQNIWPLPIKRSTFEALLSEWQVPVFILRSICRHIPVATLVEPTAEASGLTGILLRTNLSFSWQYSLATIHDPSTNVTNCVIFGLKATEIQAVLEGLEATLKSAKSQDQNAPLHLIVPTILMNIAIDVLSQDAEARRAHLLNIYQTTGLHGFNSIDRRQSKEEVQLELELLTKLTHNLTSLSDACAGIKAVCKTQFRFLETLKAFSQKVARVKRERESHACLQQLHFMSQVLHGAESKLGYIQESAQCQVQTMYSLIEQRESRTHIEHAEAAGRLAAQSHQIAELTRRDSIDMRIIAAVTMLFLPGTFMATLFSASFFNFAPRNDTSRVSSWIWLYFTLTAVLTIIVLVGWFYFARHENFIAKKEKEQTDEERKSSTQRNTDLAIKEKSVASRRSGVVRPYLSGSIAGISTFPKEQNSDEDYFAKELDIVDISPKNTFKPW